MPTSRGSKRPYHRRDTKKQIDIQADLRPEGAKEYVITVWYKDSTTKMYLKWSIVIDDQPSVVGAFNAAFAALDIESDHVAGIEVTEVLNGA
ncbi:MAG: hypothetical protein GY906_22180 [bacterium]|nr:hypothetical protein [bacterium]